MGDWLLEKNPEETFSQNMGPTAVQELVRCLAPQVANGTTCPVYAPSGDWQEVIFDTEVDGVRYLLVRFQPRSPQAHVLLSPREEEIARMVAKGYPNKTIAAMLNISPWTVCTHLRRVFAKLGVSIRAAMMAQFLGVCAAPLPGSVAEPMPHPTSPIS